MIKLRRIERFHPLAKAKFFYVLRDINIDIKEGEFVSIMGPSGAGKSSLLHILGMHITAGAANIFLATPRSIISRQKNERRCATNRSDSFFSNIISSMI